MILKPTQDSAKHGVMINSNTCWWYMPKLTPREIMKEYNRGEIVVCAAVKVGKKIWRGHRHGHAWQAAQDELLWEHTRKEITAMKKHEGFMTTHNRYVNRKEGYQLQIAAGIKSACKKPEDRYRHGELYSEDLY